MELEILDFFSPWWTVGTGAASAVARNKRRLRLQNTACFWPL